MIYLFLLRILTKSTYDKTPSKKKAVLIFTHELNKNHKVSFLGVLIDTKNNKFTTLVTKNPVIITPVPSTLKVNAPSDIKKAIINMLYGHLLIHAEIYIYIYTGYIPTQW